MKFTTKSVIAAFVSAVLLFAGCAKQELPDNREKDYGYVQFKLYKAASYEGTKAVVSQLDMLSDAAKVMVMLEYEGKEITQTLTLGSYNAENAEYGLRSEKLRLLTGTYEVLSFTLFDKVDEELYYGNASGSFEVVQGGLSMHDLTANVTPRGKVRFSLVKNVISGTKAATREFTFDEVSYVDLKVKDKSGVAVDFSMLPTDFSIHFNDKDDKEDGYQTSSHVCDTLVSLKASTYTVASYVLYDSDKNVLETNPTVKSAEFVVSDNAVTEADVPVTLRETDEYIKDYIALKKIWDALDGPNWSYKGDEWPVGANWDFNKDIDLWGAPSTQDEA